MDQSDSSHQDSFINGFTLGICAGAAGYFLYGTEQGKKLRLKLHKQWKAAQFDLQETAPELAATSLQDVFELVKKTLNQAAISAPEPVKEVKKTSPRTVKKPSTIFKGI